MLLLDSWFSPNLFYHSVETPDPQKARITPSGADKVSKVYQSDAEERKGSSFIEETTEISGRNVNLSGSKPLKWEVGNDCECLHTLLVISLLSCIVGIIHSLFVVIILFLPLDIVPVVVIVLFLLLIVIAPIAVVLPTKIPLC